jgi:hypothetical protein
LARTGCNSTRRKENEPGAIRLPQAQRRSVLGTVTAGPATCRAFVIVLPEEKRSG